MSRHQTEFDQRGFDAWLATRPQTVQLLGREFPPSRSYDMRDGTELFVIGYDDADALIVSHLNPSADYDAAFERRRVVHSACFREQLAP